MSSSEGTVLPDYEKGSIVNLMSSIASGLGSESPYESLEMIDQRQLERTENVILLILDGIGHEYLREKGKDTLLYKEMEGKVTSVFPSSTASAVPTFFTGLAPQQHAITGWYTFLKELGVVTTILPFKPRFGDRPLDESDVDISSILSSRSLMEDIDRKMIDITPEKLKDSAFNSFFNREAERRGYSSLKDLFSLLKRSIVSEDDKTYIKAYWNGFDSAAHDDGYKSVSASKAFLDVDLGLRALVEKIKDTDATLIITSDHGFIDSERERSIRLEDHPELQDCLTLPLCGDHRSVFCYVRPSKADKFEAYWEENLKDFCFMFKSEELIENDYFGLFEPDPDLPHRIGDYTLIMKDNYILHDTLANEEENFIVGNHGGISDKEMYVPVSKVELGKN